MRDSFNDNLTIIDMVNLMDFILQIQADDRNKAESIEIHQRLSSIETKIDMILDKLGDEKHD